MSEAGVTETHDNSTNWSKDQLKTIVERIERVGEEIKGLQDDQRDIYKEAAGNGFDVKALRELIRLRKQDPDKRSEHETILDTYKHAMGMLA